MSLTLPKLVRLAIWARQQKRKKFPTHGNYDITSRCTYRCEHCYFYKSYPEDRAQKDLTDKQWCQKFTDDFKNGIRYAYLTGGEPALRPKVIKLADAIFNMVVIFSNGTVKIDPQIRRSIFVSLDGPRQIHAQIRGADAWDKVMANTKDDKRVLFTCTLSTTNDQAIEEVYQIAKRQNVCGVMFGFYTSDKKDFRSDPLYLSGERRKKALAKLAELIKRDPRYVFVTPKMLKVYRDQRHKNRCSFHLKNGSALSYYPDGRRKSQCVVGEEANCDCCGCPQPVAVYAAGQLDWRALSLAEKFLRVQLP
ncbi:radical SAM protein [Patescibacteria group bacterium]